MSDQFIKNVGDPEQVKSAKKKEQQKVLDEKNDLLWILSDIRGRRFVWRLFGMCNMFSHSMRADSHLTAFNEGARNIGLTIFNEVIVASPESYQKMMSEQQEGDN